MNRVLLAMLLFAAPAAAQEPDDVQAAAAAFAQGQRAQLRRDYARAAELFEVADQAAPSAAAIRSAIRNHAQAGQHARAATLAAVAIQRYDDRETHRVADPVLTDANTELALLRVRCAPACALTLDGTAVWHEPVEALDLYADPGEHRIAASFSGRGEEPRTLSLVAGQNEELAFEPPVEVVQPEPEPIIAPPREQPAPIAPARGGVHPALFGVLVGVTAVGLGLTIWSGVDTLDARDAYVMSPTEQGYDNGVLLEARTNGLLFGSIGFGIASFIVAFFTDFGGGALVAAMPLQDGAYAMVRWEAL